MTGTRGEPCVSQQFCSKPSDFYCRELEKSASRYVVRSPNSQLLTLVSSSDDEEVEPAPVPETPKARTRGSNNKKRVDSDEEPAQPVRLVPSQQRSLL